MSNFFIALLPILVILILMVGLRWGASRSGGAGFLSALIISTLVFGATTEVIAYALMRALLLTIDVLLIIWGAFLLYRVTDEAGAIRTIGLALPHLTHDRGMQAIIIGWVFASFLQGVGGFGVPVAIVSPILIGLGFSPLTAVLIPSIGHGWAVTFGSLGSSFNALLAATNLPEKLLAPPAAAFLGILSIFVGWMVAHAAGGWGAVKRLWLKVFILGAAMGIVQFIVVSYGAWNIGSFTGSLVGLLLVFPLAYRRGNQGTNGTRLDIRALSIALSGYVILITVVLSVNFIPTVRNWLGTVQIKIFFPEVETTLGHITPAGSSRVITIFRHTGIVLFYASILTYAVYKLFGCYRSGSIQRILSGTYTRVLSSSVSIASIVAMAVLMENTGMTEALAKGLASSVGALYPMVAPWIGALGAFMTGSNTNSNVIFSVLQMHAAQYLGVSVAVILGAQTAGASIASVLAPTKVVVGASTTGMAGKEGEVMRRLFVYIGILLLILSILTLIGIFLT